ncbi:LpqB family beta-propeller domain-containing protein [Agromyces bauzanensis]|uniref:Lipoprotein LpqB n=1 Tax=Agromyces bauzanensis TaxID=1308924 RepID=A0A917PCH9_9MICO|nr:LpqB family beta-propeller domain-containing protein [Agromyces bauzanensis]GGJ71002.1 lipoprotein LpqB [Agromyces bauzanensis]
MRSHRLAASFALVCVALTGCASIPDSGSVQRGDPAPADPVEFDILVQPPADGATQEDILEGFISAAQSPRNNYAIAREFLTEAFADEWEADEGATIDVLSEREIEPVDETTLRLDATPAAELRDNGQYEEPESRAPIPFEYRFEQVDGEWRISSAPAGIVIDQVSFTGVFRPYTLYFFDPGFRYLVPDVRWYAGRESAQTSIVRSLIAGPAGWLASGVVSSFPEGVQLSPSAVTVTGEVASVSLAGAGLGDLRTAQRIQAQLDASLIGVRSIEEVSLALNGAESDVPDLSDPTPVQNPRVDPRSVVFDGETFGHLAASGEGIEPIADLSEQVVAIAPSDAALGPAGESVAVRTPAGVSLLRASEEPVTLDPRANLVTPAIDGEGVVWSVPADAPDELAWYASDGTSAQVDVPWTGTTIAAIAVSRDSTRIVALLGDGMRTHFMAASIERDADGKPVALSPVALRLDDVDGTPLDVAWLDESTVASLTQLPDGTTRIVSQELGGFARRIEGPASAVAIDGGNDDPRVLTAGGDLDVRSGVGWQVRASGIRFVAAQLPD